MLLKPDYSRTQRIGELFEAEIFSKVEDGKGKTHRRFSDFWQPFAPTSTPSPTSKLTPS
jgi:hypothetical protein